MSPSPKALHSVTGQTPPRSFWVPQTPFTGTGRWRPGGEEAAELLKYYFYSQKIIVYCSTTQTFKWGLGLYQHLFRTMYILLTHFSINLCYESTRPFSTQSLPMCSSRVGDLTYRLIQPWCLNLVTPRHDSRYLGQR